MLSVLKNIIFQDLVVETKETNLLSCPCTVGCGGNDPWWDTGQTGNYEQTT